MALPAGLNYGSPNVTVKGFNPAPGQQQPGKYTGQGLPSPGFNYQYYGEQENNGYFYDPYSDSYSPDPVKYHAYQQQIGGEPKPAKQQGLGDVLLPIAAIGGTAALAQAGGKEIAGSIRDWFHKTPTPAGTTSGASLPTPGAGTAVQPTSGGGLFDLSTWWKGAGGGTPAASTGAGAGATATPVSSATESALGIGSAGTTGAASSATGATTFADAAAAEAAGYTPVGSAVGGGVIATPGTAAPASWTTSLGSLGGVPVLPAAGAIAGTYLIDRGVSGLLGNKKNTAAGFALRTLASGGLWPAIQGARSLFKDKDKWKTEQNKLSKLAEQGTYIPENLIAEQPTKGRKLSSLIRKDVPADFVGRDDAGNWVNNQFAHTRDVKDLRGEDIVNYSAFAEHDPTWFSRPLDERIALANERLAAGAVKEHHGTIDVNFEKGAPAAQAAAPQAAAPPAGVPQPQAAPQPQPTVPGSNVTYASVARDAAPAAIPARGTRLSPGVYADGRGGTIKRAA